jgi:hypothetical protein
MSSSTRFAATDAVAREAAEDAILRGDSALSAVLSAYFALIGEYPQALGGPMSLLLYGFGAARALDGRVRQPGVGAKKTRGLIPGTAVPPSARVAVPTGWQAALVALGYDRDRRLGQVLQAGLSRAKAAGAEGRVRLLESMKSGGAGAFLDPQLHRPWLHVAGPAQGGLVTAGDFGLVPEIDKPAIRDASSLRVGWDEAVLPSGEQGIVAALDRSGGAAILGYELPEGGVEIPGWDVLAATLARPVIRGTARPKPGSFVAASAPLVLELDSAGRVVAAASSRPVVVGGPHFRLNV